MRLLGSLPSGPQPKSIAFAPGGRLFFATQLAGSGIDMYDRSTMERVGTLDLAAGSGRPGSSGFVEFAVHREKRELWVSQMETGMVHVVDIDTLQLKHSFSSRGSWTKVICFDKSGEFAFVSNWLSEDITVFSTDSYAFLGRFHIGGIPRGLAVHPDNRSLYVADYSRGRLTVHDISALSGGEQPEPEILAGLIDQMSPGVVLYDGGGAQRHIAIGQRSMKMYVSDMYFGRIDIYDLRDNSRLASVPVAPKLNTIALDSREEYLYISSRGRNNPESYLIPGPDFGKIYVMDTQTMEIVDWAWGHNQPTGLALSPDGLILVSSDFLDQNLQLYDISPLSAVHPLVRFYGRRRREALAALQGHREFAAPVKLVPE